MSISSKITSFLLRLNKLYSVVYHSSFYSFWKLALLLSSDRKTGFQLANLFLFFIISDDWDKTQDLPKTETNVSDWTCPNHVHNDSQSPEDRKTVNCRNVVHMKRTSESV
jgi:hypothetical protein